MHRKHLSWTACAGISRLLFTCAVKNLQQHPGLITGTIPSGTGTYCDLWPIIILVVCGTFDPWSISLHAEPQCHVNRHREQTFLTNRLLLRVDWMETKSQTRNASRYVDIFSVGSNVVTLTGIPSMTSSVVSVQRGGELDSGTLLAFQLLISSSAINYA